MLDAYRVIGLLPWGRLRGWGQEGGGALAAIRRRPSKGMALPMTASLPKGAAALHQDCGGVGLWGRGLGQAGRGVSGRGIARVQLG